MPDLAVDQASRPTIRAEGALPLIAALKALNYRFVAPTPATHRQVLRHPGRERARDLRGVLGWSLPFDAAVAPPAILAALQEAGAVRETADGLLQATIRVSSLDDDLFIHSAFPPRDDDAVFFGPDTYRFARLLKAAASEGAGVNRLIDVGTGSGAGAVVAAKAFGAEEIVVTDVNPRALEVARINLEAAGVDADFRLCPGLEGVDGEADLIIANPPFIAGTQRTYRDGGDMLGARLSLDWALDGAARLTPGGRFILYTGSAIVDGRDGLRDALTSELDAGRFDLAYDEIDPDIFGGQLSAPAYRDVERIAAIGAVIRRR